MRTVGAVVIAVVLLLMILALDLHVNLSASAPRGLYRTVAGRPTRGAWVVACVDPQAASLARRRSYLRPGPCVGDVQPVLKHVVALAGDAVEIRRDMVIVNGQSLPASPTSSTDSLGRPLPHAPWGRYVLGAAELWLLSTRVPNSWDSRYFGPISTSQVRSVAQPVWTVD